LHIKHFTEVSKLSERIAEQKSQLLNVKDEQDFNINQLVKHRNDLKLKMDQIKEDMENGLIDDKEKLKHLALMGSQFYKASRLAETILKCYATLPFTATPKSSQKGQQHHSTHSHLREHGVGPPKRRRWFVEEEKVSQLQRGGIEKASIIIICRCCC